MPYNLQPQILQRIVALSAAGHSQREVAVVLGVSQGCISKVLRRNRETGRPDQRNRGGRGKITSDREDRQLLRMARANRFITSTRLRVQMIQRLGRRLSARSIRRRLLAAGYRSRRPARCPRLTMVHRRRRREWGRTHRVWTLQHWRHCIFSDESRFALFHADGRVRVRRRQGERLIDACIQPTDGNRGPSVMVWGAIHHGGKSDLIVLDGTMNRHRYIRILQDHMLPWARATFGRNFVYVQDNAPPHKARDTTRFLDEQDVEVMDWPARSPDMNPIEHVWDQMGIWIRDMAFPPSTVVELQQAVRQAWDAVGPQRVRNLVESMPRRVRAVLAARGGNTRY